MEISKYEIVIIGSGAAGLFSAYNIAKRKDFNGRILIITKAPFGESNSRYAQGGISAYISRNSNDSIQLHINDTIKSGAGLCDYENVKYIIENSEASINELVSIGAGFDCDTSGNFEYTMGGGHSAKRVLHSGEDATGMIMINALCDAVKNIPNIDIMQKSMVVEILLSKTKECMGVVVFDNNKKTHEIICSQNIVIATGGAGQIYKYTTNPYGATGDGFALAYNIGATLQDLEFIQFHPTALALSSENKNRYLISEALRGEGAKLINHNGIEFMSQYSENKELAKRDIVTRAIVSEMQKEDKHNVFLNISSLNKEIILKRFPSINKKCLSCGIDITKSPIPVAPAAHYIIGGIKANVNGTTSVKGLYAIGEAASTGFQGANRLASNSLLECVVCAKKLAEDIKINNKNINTSQLKETFSEYENTRILDNNNYTELKNRVKDIMWEKVGIIRNKKSLEEAINELDILKQNIKNTKVFTTLAGYEYRNMLIISNLITKCALEREESRGAHYRSDYPVAEEIAKHSTVNK